jgi:hypothetical protein
MSPDRLLASADAHLELLRFATRGRLTEDDALVWMVLLHLYAIYLRAERVEEEWRRYERDGVVKLAGLTRRGAADVVARLWGELEVKRGRPSDPRSSYTYWYWEYSTKVPYEVVESVPDCMKSSLDELCERLAADPRVVAVLPDEE